ncbi:hypothetical protein [Nostoc sp. LPT]|uniref:hypothetical protein n=1 Tax=Nostoc sp. LPT TaxID=2815387 RepID=UPI001D75A82F|nr:hypothetical protein [Nostoc sp. LPT]MBN4004686.1 hypothetical protein [Nostoc sp. LPT]
MAVTHGTTDPSTKNSTTVNDTGMQLIQQFGKLLTFVVLIGSSMVSASSVSAKQLPIDQEPTTPGTIWNPVSTKKAMTWIINTVIYTNVYNSGKTYAQVRSDSQTDPYSGDTSINQSLSLLCIRKSPELAVDPIPNQTQSAITPGGASKNSWSGGEIFAIPNVLGSSLVSPEVADSKCEQAGQERYHLSGFKMAEFHDGSAPNAGWGFWAQSDDPNLSSPGIRYWVKINDQNANPW